MFDREDPTKAPDSGYKGGNTGSYIVKPKSKTFTLIAVAVALLVGYLILS